METWQQLMLLLIGGVIAFLFFPGVKRMLEQSEKAPKDWPAVLIPLALVVVFVIFLIMLA
jgi:predicted PurR-regulated permease PerM